MVQAQCNQSGEKVIDHNAKATVDVLELLDRRGFGYIKNTVEDESAQQCPVSLN